ncbi:acetyl-CoA carboxylase biotin carboxylase subunit family protein [Lysinibacillus xylanilyticus]|uniref:Acetyl-CoA carboxylase biotin carboxylase subunit family protein n=1 Tax=Lysinibacillus xylanilyticus TaxID=582475 RepID=A0ABV3W149_9BACI
MRVVIINRSSLKRTLFIESVLKSKHEIIWIVSKKYQNEYESLFNNVRSIEDFGSDLLEFEVLKINEEYKIDKIIATNEFDILKAGKLREKLDLEGQSYASSQAFRDKYVMKKLLQDTVKVPRFSKIDDIYELHDFINSFGYPFVLKPRDGAGSVGVEILYSENDLIEFIQKNTLHNLIAEEYIIGDMYHVDGLYKTGNLLLSQPSKYINGCLAFHNQNYLGSYNLIENNPLSIKLNSEVSKILDKLPTPLNIIPFHAEFFVTSTGEIIFCEIASRVGGGMIAEEFDHAFNLDLDTESINSQLNIEIIHNIERKFLTGFLIVHPNKGKLVSVNKNIPFEWVIDSYIKDDIVGKIYNEASSSVDAIAMLLVKGENEQELITRINTLYEWFTKVAVVWELEV